MVARNFSVRFPCRSLPAGLAVLAAFVPWTARAAFTPLGFVSPTERYSIATAISADGSTVVGYSTYPGPDGDPYLSSFKWTAAGGMVELPKSSASVPASYAYGVSADGSVIVGTEVQAGGASLRAYQYSNGAIALIPNLTSTPLGSAYGVSGDGSTVIGQAPNAYRWTAVGGTVPLPVLADEYANSAQAISSDGNAIAGSGYLKNDGGMRAFRWTEAGGIQTLPVSGTEVYTGAMSSTGSTIVGSFISQATNADIPFAWTELGVVVLSSLSTDEGIVNRAYAVTSDGTWAGGESGNQAVIWNTTSGELIILKDFLIANGVSGLEGWTLQNVTGMSGDGRALVGSGLNPQGDVEAWHVTVAAIPEPTSVFLVFLGGGLAFVRRRGKR